MSEALHTPGPWNVGPYFDNDGSPELIIEHKTLYGNMVVAVAMPGIIGQHANGLLIAAAPDLLALVQETLSIGNSLVRDVYGSEFLERALATIASATGKDVNHE